MPHKESGNCPITCPTCQMPLEEETNVCWMCSNPIIPDISEEQKQVLIFTCLKDIVRTCNRTTSGNVTHNIAAIRAMAIQTLSVIGNGT